LIGVRFELESIVSESGSETFEVQSPMSSLPKPLFRYRSNVSRRWGENRVGRAIPSMRDIMNRRFVEMIVDGRGA